MQQQPGSIDVKQPGNASHTINSIASASPDKTLDAVFSLTKKFEEHTKLTENRLNKHEEEINSLREQPRGRGNWHDYYRGPPRRPFRGRVKPIRAFIVCVSRPQHARQPQHHSFGIWGTMRIDILNSL